MKKVLFYSLLYVLISLGFTGFAQTTFNYTGGLQTYTVPAGVSTIAVDVQGANGGGVNCAHTQYQTNGGCGGRVRQQ